MSRLFITSREIALISDWTKELQKDVCGQKVYYHRIREDLSNVHDIYEESIDKVFDIPIEIEARVEYAPQETRTNQFGTEEFYTLVVFFHIRDIVDKGLKIREGDYVSYGDNYFEIVSTKIESTIYGQIEHSVGLTATWKQARKGAIDRRPYGPTAQEYTDNDAIQKEFVQQRGQPKNRLGDTNDIRELQQNGKLDSPLTSPKEISPAGDSVTGGSSFYDEA